MAWHYMTLRDTTARRSLLWLAGWETCGLDGNGKDGRTWPREKSSQPPAAWGRVLWLNR